MYCCLCCDAKNKPPGTAWHSVNRSHSDSRCVVDKRFLNAVIVFLEFQRVQALPVYDYMGRFFSVFDYMIKESRSVSLLPHLCTVHRWFYYCHVAAKDMEAVDECCLIRETRIKQCTICCCVALGAKHKLLFWRQAAAKLSSRNVRLVLGLKEAPQKAFSV